VVSKIYNCVIVVFKEDTLEIAHELTPVNPERAPIRLMETDGHYDAVVEKGVDFTVDPYAGLA